MQATVAENVSPGLAWRRVVVSALAVLLLAGCGRSASKADVPDDLATSGYRSACTESAASVSSSAVAAVAPVVRDGIWPPAGDRLAASSEVAANDFALRLLGNREPRLVVCEPGESVAVVRISPDGSGPAAELTLREVGGQGWEVVSSELVGASLSVAWPTPSDRNRLEVRGAGRLAGWTVEALDPLDARLLVTATASQGDTAASWKADVVLGTNHPPRVLFLVYRSSESVSGSGRRAPAALAVAYPVR